MSELEKTELEKTNSEKSELEKFKGGRSLEKLDGVMIYDKLTIKTGEKQAVSVHSYFYWDLEQESFCS